MIFLDVPGIVPLFGYASAVETLPERVLLENAAMDFAFTVPDVTVPLETVMVVPVTSSVYVPLASLVPVPARFLSAPLALATTMPS